MYINKDISCIHACICTVPVAKKCNVSASLSGADIALLICVS